MSVSAFLFSLQIADDSNVDSMIADLAGAVCAYAGLGKPAIEEVAKALGEAIHAGGAGSHRCDVRFSSDGGQLEIAVSRDGGGEWRTTRPLP